MKTKASLTKIDFLWRCWATVILLNLVFMVSCYFWSPTGYDLFGSIAFSDFLIAYWWLIGVTVLLILWLVSMPLIIIDSRQSLLARVLWLAATFFLSILPAILYWFIQIEVPQLRQTNSVH